MAFHTDTEYEIIYGHRNISTTIHYWESLNNYVKTITETSEIVDGNTKYRKKHSFDYLGHVLEFPISDELQ